MHQQMVPEREEKLKYVHISVYVSKQAEQGK